MQNRVIIFALAVCYVTLMSQLLYAADASRGPDLFQNNCRPCHSVDKDAKLDMYGFNLTLYGIIGRASAQVEGFFYSEAMRAKSIVWDAEMIKTFITDPQAFVPETRMMFPGLPSKTDRDDLIAFFKTLNDKH